MTGMKDRNSITIPFSTKDKTQLLLTVLLIVGAQPYSAFQAEIDKQLK